MRRILKFLMSRSFFFGVMILLQIALFVALMVTFSRVGGVAYLLITIVVVMVMMAVLERTNQPRLPHHVAFDCGDDAHVWRAVLPVVGQPRH